ncbi:MAG: alanine racemase, partial [Pontixanthobacter sp.]
GCRDFFVATWQEAAEIVEVAKYANITVLNGVMPDDMPFATQLPVKPMLNTQRQVALWRETGRPCDVMVNSGMNRLGLDADAIRAIDWNGLKVDTLASHLASADEDTPQNDEQLQKFRSAIDQIPHRRTSLANSAGVALGNSFSFDLTRPGLALYGGIARGGLAEIIRPVATIESRILQIRNLEPGDCVGYNATYRAETNMRTAIIATGYADGYLKSFSNSGIFYHGDAELPVIGRVSMDLVALDIRNVPDLDEGDWVSLPLDLPKLARQSGLSQYEILTGLGDRFDRYWADEKD